MHMYLNIKHMMKISIRIAWLIVCFLFLGTSVTLAGKPSIRILATGGTIAGAGTSASESSYTAGQVGIDVLLNAVPAIHQLAAIKGEQVANIGSQDMNDAIWLLLAQRINDLLADPEVDGIVVTHGTDTMEETAYFLNLTVKSEKPVVLVGAMRPSTSLSADGPMNLLNAVATAADRQAWGQGVMIVMNGEILSARSAIKTHTLNVASFQGAGEGPLGYVQGTKVHFLSQNGKRHTINSVFDVKGLKQLPKVGIVYCYSNVNADVMVPFLNNGYRGIVHAGVGNGNIHANLFPALQAARKKGIVVVRSSRVPKGPTSLDAEVDDKKYEFVASLELNPQKARILLMLALTKTTDWQEIQRYFQEY